MDVASGFISYPHGTMTGMDFSGDISMASTGQYIRQRWQIWQSAGYVIFALPVSGSIRITSQGQALTHSSQPMQPLMLSMVMVSVRCVAELDDTAPLEGLVVNDKVQGDAVRGTRWAANVERAGRADNLGRFFHGAIVRS